MKTTFLISVLLTFMISDALGICFEKYDNMRQYPTGARFRRTKTMGNTSLVGEYDCRCQYGGRIVCSAINIPCYDVSRFTFVGKGQRFTTRIRNQVRQCTCRGGRGRFDNCRDPTPSDSCYDSTDGMREYAVGARFRRTKQMTNSILTGIYDCQCVSAGRISCTAYDIPCYNPSTRTYVMKGRSFNTYEDGEWIKCTCKGGIGSYSCEDKSYYRSRERGCHDVSSGTTVPSGSPYFTLVGGKYMMCTCDDGQPAYMSCTKTYLNSRLAHLRATSTTPATTTTDPTTDVTLQSNETCHVYDKIYNIGEVWNIEHRGKILTCNCLKKRMKVYWTCNYKPRSNRWVYWRAS